MSRSCDTLGTTEGKVTGLFGRKKPAVPPWAAGMSESRYEAFVAAVGAYFTGQPYEIGDGVVRTGDGFEYGLVNAAQRCAQLDPREYAGFLAAQFDSIAAAARFRAGLDTKSLESVRQYLAVRVYPAEWAARLDPTGVVSRPLAGDLAAVLVYDFPQTIENVAAEDVPGWGKTVDELFEIGTDNVRRAYPLTPAPMELGGQSCFVVETDHFFAANIVFELERHAGLLGAGGALVALPTRSVAIVYPIADLGVTQAIQVVIMVAQDACAAGPGSLTDQVFWCHDGQIEILNYQVRGRTLSVIPSDAFQEMLNTLAAPGSA